MVQILDLEQCIANHINDNLNLPAELAIGEPSTHGTSIVYIMRPLQKYTNYLDGRQKRTFAFDIQIKCPSWLQATNVLNEIADFMQRTRPYRLKSSNGSFEFVKATMKQPPSFVANVTDNLDVVNGKDVPGDGIFCIYEISIEVTAIINN